MTSAQDWLLPAMGLVLAALVLWLVGAVGWVVLSILRDARRRARHPPRSFSHPTLGRLTGEDGFWLGWLGHGSAKLGVSLWGSESAPDPAACQFLDRVVAELPALEAVARRRALEGEATEATLGPLEGLTLLGPEEIEFDFSDPSHPDGCWHVLFKSGNAENLSYSD